MKNTKKPLPQTDIKKKPVPPPFPAKYSAEMCEIAIEELSQIRSIVALSARLKVSRETIYEWCRTKPEFNAAVIYGRALGEKRFDEMAVDGLYNKNFNAILWSMIGRKLYSTPETRLVKIEGLDKCKTYEEEINCIRDAVARGEITTKEGTELSNIISVKAKTYEQTEAKRLLEELEKVVGKDKSK